MPHPDAILERLSRSSFRSGFRLAPTDRAYFRSRAFQTIKQHCRDFVAQRLAPQQPRKDGRQTPWKGHPVFVAQHATATCCRGCLAKWHGIPKGAALTGTQQEYVVNVIMAWLSTETK